MPIPGKGRAMDSARDPRNETRRNKTEKNETERTKTAGVAYYSWSQTLIVPYIDYCLFNA